MSFIKDSVRYNVRIPSPLGEGCRGEVCIKHTLLFLLIFFSSSLIAQPSHTFLYVHNKGGINNYATIELKWFTENIQTGGGVTIYRQQEGSNEWTKLNSQPITSLSTYDNPKDKDREYFEELGKEHRMGKVNGILLLAIWIKAFQSNEYASFLGIYYKDTTALLEKIYRYRATLTTRLGTSEIGITENILTGNEEIFEKTIQDIQLKAGKKKVDFLWKEETTRLWAVNVYRRKAGEKHFLKVNRQPIMPSQLNDENGNPNKRERMYEEDSLEENTLYEYQFTGIDFFGNESELSGIYPIYIKDQTAPEMPRLEKDSVLLQKVWLKWNKVIDPDVNGYHVFRSLKSEGPYEKLTQYRIQENSFIDQTPATANWYYFITVSDTAGNETPSNKIIVNVEDVVAPTVPEGLTINADAGVLLLQWNKNTEKDLWGYYIYRGLDPKNPKSMVLMNVNPIQESSFNDTINKVAKNTFYYRIAAVDSNYNASKLSEAIGAQMPDIIPPSKPFIKRIDIDNNELIIRWIQNTEKDVRGYELYIFDAITNKYIRLNKDIIDGNKYEFRFKPDVTEKEYTFRLTAYDTSMNESEFSDTYNYHYKSSNIPDGANEHIKLSIKAEKDRSNIELKWKYYGNKSIIKGYVVYFISSSSGESYPLSGFIKQTSFKYIPVEKGELNYEVRMYTEEGIIIKSERKTINH